MKPSLKGGPSRGRSEHDFSPKTKREIRERAGGLCCDPSCLRTTSVVDSGMGDAAHIYSASSDGPRGHGGLTKEELIHSSNGIWLCKNHHKLVDPKNKPLEASTLYEWKAVREASHFAIVHNDDLGKLVTLIGVRAVDDLVRQQYANRNPDVVFSVDSKSIAGVCWREWASRVNLMQDQVPCAEAPRPYHLKKTMLSAEVAGLDHRHAGQLHDGRVPAPYATKAPAHENGKPVDLFRFTDREMGGLFEIVEAWRSSAASCGDVGRGLVIHYTTYALAPTTAGSIDWCATLPVNATAIFSLGIAGQEQRWSIKISQSLAPLSWEFRVSSGDGLGDRFSKIKFQRYRLNRYLMPEEYPRLEAIEKLLVKLTENSRLVGMLSPRFNTHIWDPKDADFQSIPLPIDFGELRADEILVQIFQARRQKLLLKLSAGWKSWYLTRECFDAALTDFIIQDGLLRLEAAEQNTRQPRVTVDLLIKDGYTLQLIGLPTSLRISRKIHGIGMSSRWV